MIHCGFKLVFEFTEDSKREVKKSLIDIITLIAYENVMEGNLAPLQDTSGRIPVADKLGSTILGELFRQ